MIYKNHSVLRHQYHLNLYKYDIFIFMKHLTVRVIVDFRFESSYLRENLSLKNPDNAIDSPVFSLASDSFRKDFLAKII